jgi:hypothetical protein
LPDNVSIKDAADVTVPVATDEIAGVAHQRVKVQFGADGFATDASTANPLPVSDAGGSLTVDGTVAVSNPTANPETGLAKDATLTARLPSALDADGGLKVHNQNFPATQPVSGTVGVSNFPAVQPVSDNGGSLTVDGTVGVSGTVAVDSELPAAAALADGATNPTAPTVGAAGLLWNGASWDRRLSRFETTTGDTGTKTATFNGATQTSPAGAIVALIVIRLGTVSGTSPTFSTVFQFSPDAGVTWVALATALGNLTASNQIGKIGVGPLAAAPTGGTANQLVSGVLPKTWRLVVTIGGTTPSFALTAVNVLYSGA